MTGLVLALRLGRFSILLTDSVRLGRIKSGVISGMGATQKSAHLIETPCDESVYFTDGFLRWVLLGGL